ncbi:hemolysin family protein [Candidatus Neomarinimicrobiota bacterium]
MTMHMLIDVFLFFILLVVSGVLSGAETAFFKVQSRLRDYGDERKGDFSPAVLAILKQPRQLLISLLTGNTVVNVTMAFMSALITADFARAAGLNLNLLIALESIVVTVIILLFGEVMPKILAMRYAANFARVTSWPVKWLVILLYPVGRVIYGLTSFVARLTRIKPETIFTSEEELRNLADVGHDRGTLEESEKQIIHSILEFSDTAVHEVMTPRVDIMALEARAGIKEAIEIVRDRQFSKIPVFKESIDDIKGILYAKDILPYLNGPYPDVNLIRLSRQPFFIPESKGIASLLQDFKAKRTSIAIVVDEFGGTAGLVTLEDVVEEVLGELRDPYDLGEAEISSTGEDEFMVDAAVTLDDLTDWLNLSFPEERDYDTLGGFLFDQFDDIPEVGQKIMHDQRCYTVKVLDGNRISKVHISSPVLKDKGLADEVG